MTAVLRAEVRLRCRSKNFVRRKEKKVLEVILRARVFEKPEGPENVRFDERERIFDGIIDVRFGGRMQNVVELAEFSTKTEFHGTDEVVDVPLNSIVIEASDVAEAVKSE
jgi:hypothetical protein